MASPPPHASADAPEESWSGKRTQKKKSNPVQRQVATCLVDAEYSKRNLAAKENLPHIMEKNKQKRTLCEGGFGVDSEVDLGWIRGGFGWICLDSRALRSRTRVVNVALLPSWDI